MENNQNQYTPSDYKNKQSVRWAPGCGDHAILNALHKAMAELRDSAGTDRGRLRHRMLLASALLH